ncbi:MAG: DNA-binding transcriptional LysR family regulator [Polyangiales bacterium]|jgi:DNA-binding transcriptional LysR family regulator
MEEMMDRLSEMEAFTAVAEAGGFTAAARTLGCTTSSVSKQVRALEERLGVRLLNRTTRRVSLTEIGIAFRDRARAVLHELEDAELAVSQQQQEPRGVLRVGAPVDFGRIGLAESLATFIARHSDLRLEVDLADRFVDVVEEGFDVVVRIANLPDSSLVARRMGPCRRVLCAAPSYLEARGRPARPTDLSDHTIIGYSHDRTRRWMFRTNEGEVDVAVKPSHSANNGEMIRRMLLAGLGIALLPTFLVGDDLRAGRLEPLLVEQLEADTTIWAVTPHRKLLATKVRLLLDHLVSGCGDPPPWDAGLTEKGRGTPPALRR